MLTLFSQVSTGLRYAELGPHIPPAAVAPPVIDNTVRYTSLLHDQNQSELNPHVQAGIINFNHQLKALGMVTQKLVIHKCTCSGILWSVFSRCAVSPRKSKVCHRIHMLIFGMMNSCLCTYSYVCTWNCLIMLLLASIILLEYPYSLVVPSSSVKPPINRTRVAS